MTTAVKFVGVATGPNLFVKELGFEVPTFDIEPGGKRDALKHHVPLAYRGDFRPHELADYDEKKEYRVDALGKVLCYGKTQAGELCKRRAQNRFPRCDFHGGKLHPLDLIATDDETATDDSQGQALSRYRQFLAKQITVDDLDDEELACCGFRDKAGRLYKPRNVPREMNEAFQKAIFQRAELELRSLTIDAVRTVGEIMRNTTNEPDIRLKAALSAIERNLGKTPQIVNLTHTVKPYEEIFDSIGHVRSERPSEPRQLESGEQQPVDAEVVWGEQSDSNSTVTQGNSGDGTSSGTGKDESDYGTAGFKDERDPGSIQQSVDYTDGNELPRNEAVFAQILDPPTFTHEDNSKDIKKATQKRYASRILGVDLTGPNTPFVVQITKTKRNTIMIKHTEPLEPKMPRSVKDAAKRRKSFTLNDFG